MRVLIKNRGNNDSRTLSSILPGIDLGTVDDFGGGLAIKVTSSAFVFGISPEGSYAILQPQY